jgi:hypothetical protein
MTAVSPMVLLLIGVALVVAVVMCCAAFGRLPLHMDGPDDPWWAGRRSRAGRSGRRGQDTCGPTSSRSPEIASDQRTEGERTMPSQGSDGPVVNKHTSDLE